jgi:tetratricopeptide (TPR) repeat protein
MYRNDVIEAFSYLQKAYDCGGYLWPEIHYTISLLYSSIGDYSKALKYMHTALSMSSNCNYIRSSFYILSARESYNEALEFIDSIRRITPCEQACDIMKFYLFTAQKKSDQAEMFLNKALSEGYKLGWDDYIYKSCLYKGTGRKSEDFLKIKQIVAREENVLQTRRSFWASETALRAAAGYAILGDNRKAMTYIKLLEKYGCNDNPFPLRSFPGFDNLRNDPEFEETVKRIEEKRDSIRAEVKMMEQQGEINL